ncbi:diguanylate cyclase [Marinobacterium rhizophilum]|uniref:diguanylate cyclase n=1 Tax=Marinobacterium rhizophilum TaxID=420402 RepID=A0ABY5HRU0_9GAMM|nr:diguanylate cyclase [Marinobacterium rhizophilum]UTW13895.1 diguanylate cyclase [Marinobacterium rhizophilum]
MMNATQRRRGRQLVRRIYPSRGAGFALGAISVASVLFEQGAGPASWLMIAFSGLVWPHLAYWHAHLSDNPYRSEKINQHFDAAQCGFWTVMMGFNLLPSVMAFSMLGMVLLSLGGKRRCLNGMLVYSLSAAVTWLPSDVPTQLQSSLFTLLASIPALLFYPLLIGYSAYRFALAANEQRKQLEIVSRTDGLSGLFNRQHWEQRVAEAFASNQKDQSAYSLLMLDIDYFKQVNDRFGHVAGDDVIRQVARLLEECFQQSACIGRYGGDEFGILLPDCNAAQALERAEQARQHVFSRLHSNSPATLSLGIAELNADKESYADWILHADLALYQAKRQGRNRAVCFSELDDACLAAEA